LATNTTWNNKKLNILLYFWLLLEPSKEIWWLFLLLVFQIWQVKAPKTFFLPFLSWNSAPPKIKGAWFGWIREDNPCKQMQRNPTMNPPPFFIILVFALTFCVSNHDEN
jgi:hypothetical protein